MMVNRDERSRRVSTRRRDIRRCLARMKQLKRAQKYREALAELTALQAMIPNNISVWGHTAEVAILCGEDAMAWDAAARGLTLTTATRHPQWRTHLLISGGIAAHYLGSAADAIHLLEEALTITATHPVAHLYLAYAYRRCRDYARARTHVRQTLTLLARSRQPNHETLTRLAHEEVARLAAEPTADDPASITNLPSADVVAIFGMLFQTKKRAPPPRD